MAGDDMESLYDDRPRFGVVPHAAHTCPRPAPRETPRPDCPLSGLEAGHRRPWGESPGHAWPCIAGKRQ